MSEEEAVQPKDMDEELAPSSGSKPKRTGFRLDFMSTLIFIPVVCLVGLLAFNILAGPEMTQDRMIDKIFGNTSAEESKNSATEALPEAPAPADSEPMDLSPVWSVLGIAGGAAGVVGISALSVGAVKRSRRHSLEHRAAVAAAAEDHRKARGIWQKYADTHGALKAKALEIETDWDMLFSYPTLLDATVPQTREFHRALRAADVAATEPPADLNLSMDIAGFVYPKSVVNADEAWTAAWSFAQRTGTKLIPSYERKKIDQIVKLLKLARDSGGSEHERSVAYDRASKLIGELQFVRAPEATLRAIGAESRRMIERPAGRADGIASPEPVALKVGA